MPAKRPTDRSTWLNRAIQLLAGLQITVALLVIIAWLGDQSAWTRIDARFAPMHPNAALGMFIWGLGLFGVARGWRSFTQCLGGLLVVGSMVLFAHVFGAADWGLDRWPAPADAVAVSFPPGGVGTPATFAFLLGGIVSILATRPARLPEQSLLIALCGFLLFMGAIALLIGQPTNNGSSAPLGPPLLFAFGTLAGGLAFVLFATRQGLGALPFGYGLPLLVGLTGIAFSLILWRALNGQQFLRIQRSIQSESAYVDRLLEDSLAARMNALNDIAGRMRGQPDADPRFREMTAEFVARQPGCFGMARIEPAKDVQWIEAANVARLPKTLAEIGVEESLDPFLATGKPAVLRAPRSKWSGTRVLILFAPIDPGSPQRGGLIAAIRLQEFIDAILNRGVAPGYALTLADRDETVYGRYAAEKQHQETFHQSLPVQFQNARWTLRFWPTPEAMSREDLSLPKLALAVSLSTTILLVAAVHLAQMARRRARDLEKEIRERIQAEGALKQSETKYRSLIENLEQGVFLKDRDGRYVAANNVYCGSIALPERDVIGSTDDELFDTDDARRHAEEVRLVFANDKRIENEDECAIEGKTHFIRRILTPVRDAAGQVVGALGICWDVTEQRLIEARLRQAGKMDAIGQLAGGIAHDFNNLLTAILGNLDLMLGTLSDGERNHELVLAAQHAALRAASLTTQLLGFSRQHRIDWAPTDLDGIVDEVVTLLGRTIDPRIRIETKKSSHNWPVLADSSQLNQVVMNLCLNARDAISGSGRISIETECVEVTEMQALSETDARVGSFTRLRVVDTGSGMSPEIRTRIFEPFFTTKGVGKGTGLGLAMVFSIVRQHHGWIECRSEVGQGTEFDVYLPRSAAALEETPVPAPVAEATPRGHATILVVDDEPMIRRLAVLVLERSGFEVIEAEDGQQAVDIYERERDRIDLVLLDLTMPNLSGQEAFRQMWQINPDVKALFASGYAAEQITPEEQRRILGFVKKPYRPNELVQSIDEALARARQPDSSHDLVLTGCEG